MGHVGDTRKHAGYAPHGRPESHCAGVREWAQESHILREPGGGMSGGAGPRTPAADDEPGWAWPLRRAGCVVVGGFSEAWHLFTWRESRSLWKQVRYGGGKNGNFQRVPSRELVATVNTFIWAVTSVWSRSQRDIQVRVGFADGIACGELHVGAE